MCGGRVFFLAPPRLPFAPNHTVLAPSPVPPPPRGSAPAPGLSAGKPAAAAQGGWGGRNRPGEEGNLCPPPRIYSPLETKAASAAGMRLAWLLPGLFSRLKFGFDALQERSSERCPGRVAGPKGKSLPRKIKNEKKTLPRRSASLPRTWGHGAVWLGSALPTTRIWGRMTLRL